MGTTPISNSRRVVFREKVRAPAVNVHKLQARCGGNARGTHRLLAAAVVAVATSVATPAFADAAAFYRGNQGRLFTMGTAGGGYDTYTRAVSAFLEKRIGVRLVPTNEPAASGLIAMNRMINAAPDGLTLLLTAGEGMVTAQLYGSPGVNYDVRKQVFLARVSGEDKVAVFGPKSPYMSVADIQALGRQMIWASSGKVDGNSDFSAIMCYVLGVNCKIILGYKGTSDINMAIQRAEVDGRVISDEAAALYGASAGMRVLAVLARQRSEKFPNVPTIFEAAKLSASAERLLSWRANIASLGRVILVTPGTPPERVDFLRKELAQVLQDPAFIAEMKKVNLSASYLGAEALQASAESAMTTLDAKGLAEMKGIALDRYYH